MGVGVGLLILILEKDAGKLRAFSSSFELISLETKKDAWNKKPGRSTVLIAVLLLQESRCFQSSFAI
jgi:hypothetical protein